MENIVMNSNHNRLDKMILIFRMILYIYDFYISCIKLSHHTEAEVVTLLFLFRPSMYRVASLLLHPYAHSYSGASRVTGFLFNILHLHSYVTFTISMKSYYSVLCLIQRPPNLFKKAHLGVHHTPR